MFSKDMPLQISSLSCTVETDRALVWLLSCVGSYMFTPIPSVEESFSTHTTPIHSSAQMVLSLVAEEVGVRLRGVETIHFYAYHGPCQHAL